MTHSTFGMSRAGETKKNDKKPVAERIIGIVCRLAIVSFVVLVFTNHLVSLLAALYHIPQDLPSRWNIYAWFNTTYIVMTLREAGVLGYFLFIVFYIFASLVWVTRKEGGEALSAIRDGDMLSQSRNSIVLLFQLLFVYFFFFAVYWQVMAWLGVEFTLYPAGNQAISSREVFSLTSAAVYEEIFFRVLLLGAPLLVIAFIMFLAGHRKKVPLPHRFLLGGGSDLGAPAIAFLFISSLYFALAHVQLSQQEPAIALLPPTLLAGLILGYLFLEKGIHLAVIFHFVVNYMFMLTYMDNAGLILGPVAAVFGFISTAAFYLVLVLGAVPGPFYVLYFSRKSLLFIRAGVEDAKIFRRLRGTRLNNR